MTKIFTFTLFACAVLAAGCMGELSRPQNISMSDASGIVSRNATYELYSWQEGESWEFVLISGTTRLSSFKEITSTYNSIAGTDGLLRVLDTLPRGTTIFWNLRQIDGFEFPSGGTLDRIEQAAENRGINLQAIQRL